MNTDATRGGAWAVWQKEIQDKKLEDLRDITVLVGEAVEEPRLQEKDESTQRRTEPEQTGEYLKELDSLHQTWQKAIQSEKGFKDNACLANDITEEAQMPIQDEHSSENSELTQ